MINRFKNSFIKYLGRFLQLYRHTRSILINQWTCPFIEKVIGVFSMTLQCVKQGSSQSGCPCTILFHHTSTHHPPDTQPSLHLWAFGHGAELPFPPGFNLYHTCLLSALSCLQNLPLVPLPPGQNGRPFLRGLCIYRSASTAGLANPSCCWARLSPDLKEGLAHVPLLIQGTAEHKTHWVGVCWVNE